MAIEEKKDIINFSRVYPRESREWRQHYSANTFNEKYPTQTMRTLYKMFINSVISEKSIEFRDKIIDKMYEEWKTSEHGPISTEEEMNELRRLQRTVFGYYRRRFNDILKSDGCILLHEAFDIIRMIEDDPNFIDDKLWINLVTAATQSGKTFLMIALSHIYISLGYTPIFIVKDTKQNIQFFSRKITDSKKLQTFLEEEKFSKDNIALFDKPLYYDSNIGLPGSAAEEEFNNNVESALNGSKPRGIVCIHNVKHITRVYNNIKCQSKFVLFVDEAHKLGAYKIKGIHSDNTSNEGAYDMMYLQLKCFASKIFLFTATPQNIYFSEPELFTNGIIHMSDRNTYHGSEMWNIKLLPPRKEDKDIKIDTIDGHAILPQSFIDTMADLSDENPSERINKFGIMDCHPINMLAKFECINERQALILGAFSRDVFPVSDIHKKIINANWAVMTFNQFGVRIFHESLRGETMKIGNNTIIDISKVGVFSFPEAEIGEVWHWMATNGGVVRFSRIVTVAYRSAEEGISFSSTWGSTYNDDANWHLTNEYIRLGSGCHSSAAEQSFGRINGNHGDTLRPTLHCSLADKKKVLKGINLHQEQTRAMCELAFRHLNEKVIDHVTDMEVFKNRIPNNYVNIPGCNKIIKRKMNPNEDIEEESFTRHNNALNIFQMINPDVYNGYELREKTREENNNSIYNISNESKEAIDSYGIEDYKWIIDMLKKWSCSSSNIAKFVKKIDPTKFYSDSEFKKLCNDTGVDPTHTQRKSYGNSRGYGRIIEKVGNRFRVYSVLVNPLSNVLKHTNS